MSEEKEWFLSNTFESNVVMMENNHSVHHTANSSYSSTNTTIFNTSSIKSQETKIKDYIPIKEQQKSCAQSLEFHTSFIYTEKEQALHVHGEWSTICDFEQFEVNGDDINFDEIEQFYQFGYVTMKSMIPNNLILLARQYIDTNYQRWLKCSKRQDDWRIHFNQRLDRKDQYVEHGPILNLLLLPNTILRKVTSLMGRNPCGIFYTQIALRTPTKNISKPSEGYQNGAEYHLDGNANGFGIRFPDPWTVMIGIALVDIDCEDKGNFTVFPGSHIHNDWGNYPSQKQSKSLPNLGQAKKLCLKAGDVIFVHVLLAHRGGRNTLGKSDISTLEGDCESECKSDYDYKPSNIPMNTREMIFFRIQGEGIDYESSSRGEILLHDPMIEFQQILEIKGLR